MSPSDMGAGLGSGTDVEAVFAGATACISAIVVADVVAFGDVVCDGVVTGLALVIGVAPVEF